MRKVQIDKLYYINDDKFDYSKYTDLYVLNFLIDDDNYNLCGSKIFKTKDIYNPSLLHLDDSNNVKIRNELYSLYLNYYNTENDKIIDILKQKLFINKNKYSYENIHYFYKFYTTIIEKIGVYIKQYDDIANNVKKALDTFFKNPIDKIGYSATQKLYLDLFEATYSNKDTYYKSKLFSNVNSFISNTNGIINISGVYKDKNDGHATALIKYLINDIYYFLYINTNFNNIKLHVVHKENIDQYQKLLYLMILLSYIHINFQLFDNFFNDTISLNNYYYTLFNEKYNEKYIFEKYTNQSTIELPSIINHILQTYHYRQKTDNCAITSSIISYYIWYELIKYEEYNDINTYLIKRNYILIDITYKIILKTLENILKIIENELNNNTITPILEQEYYLLNYLYYKLCDNNKLRIDFLDNLKINEDKINDEDKITLLNDRNNLKQIIKKTIDELNKKKYDYNKTHSIDLDLDSIRIDSFDASYTDDFISKIEQLINSNYDKNTNQFNQDIIKKKITPKEPFYDELRKNIRKLLTTSSLNYLLTDEYLTKDECNKIFDTLHFNYIMSITNGLSDITDRYYHDATQILILIHIIFKACDISINDYCKFLYIPLFLSFKKINLYTYNTRQIDNINNSVPNKYKSYNAFVNDYSTYNKNNNFIFSYKYPNTLNYIKNYQTELLEIYNIISYSKNFNYNYNNEPYNIHTEITTSVVESIIYLIEHDKLTDKEYEYRDNQYENIYTLYHSINNNFQNKYFYYTDENQWNKILEIAKKENINDEDKLLYEYAIIYTEFYYIKNKYYNTYFENINKFKNNLNKLIYHYNKRNRDNSFSFYLNAYVGFYIMFNDEQHEIEVYNYLFDTGLLKYLHKRETVLKKIENRITNLIMTCLNNYYKNSQLLKYIKKNNLNIKYVEYVNHYIVFYIYNSLKNLINYYIIDIDTNKIYQIINNDLLNKYIFYHDELLFIDIKYNNLDNILLLNDELLIYYYGHYIYPESLTLHDCHKQIKNSNQDFNKDTTAIPSSIIKININKIFTNFNINYTNYYNVNYKFYQYNINEFNILNHIMNNYNIYEKINKNNSIYNFQENYKLKKYIKYNQDLDNNYNDYGKAINNILSFVCMFHNYIKNDIYKYFNIFENLNYIQLKIKDKEINNIYFIELDNNIIKIVNDLLDKNVIIEKLNKFKLDILKNVNTLFPLICNCIFCFNIERYKQLNYYYSLLLSIHNNINDFIKNINSINNIYDSDIDFNLSINEKENVININQNTINKINDTINKTKDIINKTSDVFNRTKNTFKQTNDIIDKTKHVINDTKKAINEGKQILNDNEYNISKDIYDKTDDIFRKHNNIYNVNENILKNSEDILKENEEVFKENTDIYNEYVNIINDIKKSLNDHKNNIEQQKINRIKPIVINKDPLPIDIKIKNFQNYFYKFLSDLYNMFNIDEIEDKNNCYDNIINNNMNLLYFAYNDNDQKIIQNILNDKISFECSNIIKSNYNSLLNITNKKIFIKDFETYSGYFVRNSNINLLYDIINNQNNNKEDKSIFTIDMGQGKTTTITPLLIKYYFDNYENIKQVFIVLPKVLVNQSYEILNNYSDYLQTLIVKINDIKDILKYDEILMKFTDINNNVFFSIMDNNILQYFNNYIKNIKKIFIISEETFKQYYNDILHTNYKYIINNEQFENNTIIIYDEIDTLMNPMRNVLNVSESTTIFKEFIKTNKTIETIYNIYVNKFVKLFTCILLKFWELYNNKEINKQLYNVLELNKIINSDYLNTLLTLSKDCNKETEINNIIIKLLNDINKVDKVDSNILRIINYINDNIKEMKYNKDYGLNYLLKENIIISVPYAHANNPMINMYFNDIMLTVVLSFISYIYYTVLNMNELLEKQTIEENTIENNLFLMPEHFLYTLYKKNNIYHENISKDDYNNASFNEILQCKVFNDVKKYIIYKMNNKNKKFYYDFIYIYINNIILNINNISFNNKYYTYSFFDILDNKCIKFGFSGTTHNIDMKNYILINDNNELLNATDINNKYMFKNIKGTSNYITNNHIKSFLFPNICYDNINKINCTSSDIKNSDLTKLYKKYYIIDTLSNSFIDDLCKMLIKNNIKCFIDVGAFLKYISINNFITHYIKNKPIDYNINYIIYYDLNDKLRCYDINKNIHEYINKYDQRTKNNDCLYLYMNKDIVGKDIKQNTNTEAIVSYIYNETTFTDIIQGIYRLRQINKGQVFYLLQDKNEFNNIKFNTEIINDILYISIIDYYNIYNKLTNNEDNNEMYNYQLTLNNAYYILNKIFKYDKNNTLYDNINVLQYDKDISDLKIENAIFEKSLGDINKISNYNKFKDKFNINIQIDNKSKHMQLQKEKEKEEETKDQTEKEKEIEKQKTLNIQFNIFLQKNNNSNYIYYNYNNKDYNKTNIALIPYIYKVPIKRLKEKLNTYLYVGERDILYNHYINKDNYNEFNISSHTFDEIIKFITLNIKSYIIDPSYVIIDYVNNKNNNNINYTIDDSLMLIKYQDNNNDNIIFRNIIIELINDIKDNTNKYNFNIILIFFMYHLTYHLNKIYNLYKYKYFILDNDNLINFINKSLYRIDLPLLNEELINNIKSYFNYDTSEQFKNYIDSKIYNNNDIIQLIKTN